MEQALTVSTGQIKTSINWQLWQAILSPNRLRTDMGFRSRGIPLDRRPCLWGLLVKPEMIKSILRSEIKKEFTVC